MRESLGKQVLAELVGTFLLVFFGCGAVHVAVLFGGLNGLWQVGVVWGLAIMFAAYTVGPISGAHLNPAVTLGLAFWNKFPKAKVLPYLGGQMAGALLAATVLFLLFQQQLTAFENKLSIQRGAPASVLTAMCYGEYYLNPGGYQPDNNRVDDVQLTGYLHRLPTATAFLAELLGTAILGFVIGRLTAGTNDAVPARFAPVFIGLTVTALICVIAPLTQACFNPARDLGPRLVAYVAGWGNVALPGPNGLGFVLVYVVAPIAGAILGLGLAEKLHGGPPTAK